MLDKSTTFFVWTAVLYLTTTCMTLQTATTSVIYSPCPELCICSEVNKSAICDGYGNKTLQDGVPLLPSYVRNLILKSFNISNLTKNTFSNTKTLNLIHMEIKNSTIWDIDQDTFSVFSHCPNLSLVIGHNVVEERKISTALLGLRNVSLAFLDLRHLNISDRHGVFFDTLNGLRIRRITVNKNYLTVYNHSKFANVSGLVYLDLSGNDINVTTLSYSSSLVVLKLGYNRIHHFPHVCRKNAAIFPNLHGLHLDHNQIHAIHSKFFSCLKQLVYFDLSRNYFTTIPTNTFAYLPNLGLVRLRNMMMLIHVETYAFNNSQLKSIILRDNRMELQHVLHEDSFAGCSSLLSLDLSYNMLVKLPGRHAFMRRLLGHLTSLRFLSLGSTYMSEVPDAVLSLTNLEILELFTNYVSKLPHDFFSKLPKLREVYLATNSFSSLDADDFPPEVRRSLQVLDLSVNPFVCDCKMLWFVQWMKNSPTIFHESYKYTCTTSDGSKVKELLSDESISPNSCLLSRETSLAIASFSLFLVCLLIVSSMAYRWRWSLKHFIYMLRYKETTELDGNYSFDAFVIYCEKDRNWVKDELIPNLEIRLSFTLCIHERDFMPGALIVDNVVDSLIRSRHVILVLSNDFARDEWCQFEMSLCQAHVIDRSRSPMRAVLLGEMSTCYLTKSMYAVLKTSKYYVWPGYDDSDAKHLFWEEMRRALSPPLISG